MPEFKLRLLGVLFYVLLCGFTCEKYKFYEVVSEPVACDSVAIKGFEAEKVSFSIETAGKYCPNAIRFQYGAKSKRDVQRGLIFKEESGPLCVVKLLIVAPPYEEFAKTPFEPLQEATQVWDLLSKKKAILNLVNSDPKDISSFKHYCEGK